MEESDGETADSVWFGYECKSGEILFYCNQKTGEHRWAKDLGCSESNIIKVSISDLSVQHPSDVHSVGTQTEDYGCTNGCSSIYIHNEDHTVTSNRDESMCPVDRPSNICGVSVDDSDHLEQSETMIPNREDKDSVIDEEWNGGSEKLENDEDCILTDSCQSTENHCSFGFCKKNTSESTEESTVNGSCETDSCQSTGLLPENPPENEAKCNEESDGETQNSNFDCMMIESCQSSIVVPMLIKEDKSIGNRNEALSHKSNLNCCIKTHTCEEPYKCSHCKKAFSQKRYLKLHVRTHTKEKPFKCSYCGKAFSSKSNLNCHIKGHTSEKPFKCSQCDRAFSRKSDLNCHIRMHTGEKPFNCSQCGKAFSRKSNLNRHIRMHTGEKPFKCSHCGKAFSQKSSLNNHIRTHTGGKPFKCSQCGKAFTRKYSLSHHIQQIHTNSNTIHL